MHVIGAVLCDGARSQPDVIIVRLKGTRIAPLPVTHLHRRTGACRKRVVSSWIWRQAPHRHCSLTRAWRAQMEAPRPLVVVGPSGVGKGTLIARLMVRPCPARFTPCPYALPQFRLRRRVGRLTTRATRPECLCLRLQADYPSLFGFSVSHTTRAPRPGEVDGVHYHFTNHDAFLADVAAGAHAARSSRRGHALPETRDKRRPCCPGL